MKAEHWTAFVGRIAYSRASLRDFETLR